MVIDRRKPAPPHQPTRPAGLDRLDGTDGLHQHRLLGQPLAHRARRQPVERG
jgi:hypothetical protein